MEFINVSKNTLFVEDIGLHIPFLGDKTQEIDADLLKKSTGIVNLFLARILEIVKYDKEERIEASIAYRVMNMKQAVPKSQVTLNESKNLDIEVNLHGIFYDVSGYGKVNRNFAVHLAKHGIKVKVDPKKSINQLTEQELSEVVALEKTSISRDHIRIDSVIPSFTELYSGKYRILYTTIESYTVPQQFIDCCNMYDEVWVNSTWSKEILEKLIKKPVFVIISGANTDLYKELGPAFDLSTSCRSFKFLSIFAWGYRKGWDVLLKSYFQEFSDEDDVTLLISSRYQGGQSLASKNKITEDIDSIMKQYPNKSLPHIARFNEVLQESQMPMLYRACNAFVLTSRGESICLPPIEASLCGLPVIMTNCSGQTSYLRKNNSYMIDIDRLEPLPVGKSHIHYWDGQMFPSLTSNAVFEQTGKHMRRVYENYKEAKKRNKEMQKLLKKEFTWDRAAEQAIERLSIINKKLKEK